jgi:hypothetical protein
MPIPKFTALPNSIRETLITVCAELHDWEELPRIAPDVVEHWDRLIDDWSVRDELPLLIRRSSHDYVCMEFTHRSGRLIAPCDNSPAHWVAIKCFDGLKPHLDELATLIRDIPMTMALSKREIEAGGYLYTKTLSSLPHAGKQGWYLAHKKQVAQGTSGKLEDIPIETLRAHFCRFLKPSNFMLIPKQVAGLAELDCFFAGV